MASDVSIMSLLRKIRLRAWRLLELIDELQQLHKDRELQHAYQGHEKPPMDPIAPILLQACKNINCRHYERLREWFESGRAHEEPLPPDPCDRCKLFNAYVFFADEVLEKFSSVSTALQDLVDNADLLLRYAVRKR